jgi:hypothetical protein
MSFKRDCDATPGLAGAAKPGLQALNAADRGRVSPGPGTKLTHGIDVDGALSASLPNDARWDYGVARKVGGGVSGGEQVHWIVVHPVSGEASLQEMQNKLTWLRRWLAGTALNAYPRQLVWVASGKSAFTGRDPKVKALALQGLRFAGGHLAL